MDSAIALVNTLIYKPGWRISATDHSRRFQGAITVKIDYPARRSEREFAPDFTEQIETYASFPIIVEDITDEVELFRRVMGAVLSIEIHEGREFFRVTPTWWAPFHPHRVDGMKRWGTETADLTFGIA